MTINKSQFRFLIAIEISLGVISIIACQIGESSLPLELQKYLTSYYESNYSVGEWLLLSVSIVALMSHIGIFFFVRWSRSVFTISYLLASAMMVLDKATVQTNVEGAFSELSIFCAGFIVACMYLTNIKEYFENKKA